ncbi:MAG: SMI1/KNR4 family protein [Lachnospiraceae bacterium]|nr:SMI1/KNR4 family protein [Lachnospiraceae bacterium]
MIRQEDKNFVEHGFQKLQERGWFPNLELEPSTITEEEIEAFEMEHQITLPSLYKAFLTSRRLPSGSYQICSITDARGDESNLRVLWLEIDIPKSMEQISEQMETLKEIQEFCDLPDNSFQYLIPIGDWGAAWGPLCIDLSNPENEVVGTDKNTWSLVWFDHEEFAWDEVYLDDDDGLLHGSSAAPTLKKLLEWYFYGSLEAKYEEKTGEKLTYKWYIEGMEDFME